MVQLRLITCLVLGLLLAACASTGGKRGSYGKAPTPHPHVKVGGPYTIGGITYRPHHDPNYSEEGVASWYGPKFHGKLTANGEIFDQNRLTAAHRTLPLPSLVRVTNLENGRSEVLRLNDRGPFAGNRIIDLSKAAAKRLGTKEKGLAQVRVDYLGPADLHHAIVALGEKENHDALRPPPTRVASAPPRSVRATAATPVSLSAASALPVIEMGAYYVNVGAFAEVSAAQRAAGAFPETIPMELELVPDGPGMSYALKLGPYDHEFSAVEAHRAAISAGFSTAHIVQDVRAR